jgi:hypothetical protein
MTEQPWDDSEPNPDDANDAQLPDPDADGPARMPSRLPDYGGSLDLPESPDQHGDVEPVM